MAKLQRAVHRILVTIMCCTAFPLAKRLEKTPLAL
jgi:hypothetical protein